jgi:hypothetical protein
MSRYRYPNDPGHGCIAAVGGVFLIVVIMLAIFGAYLQIKGYTP